MEPSIHVRNIKLTPRLRNYVGKKTERLDRYMPNLAELRVDLAEQNARNSSQRTIAQVTVRDERGTILRAEESNSDIFAAVDMVVDKLYRQIHRYRGKQRRNRRAAPTVEEMDLVNLEPLPIEEDSAEIDLEEGAIVRRKRFAMQPMSPEEAIDQMDLLGHDFYMFFNMEEEAVNVVYRRNNDAYGLLQPEFD